ncbi:MAG: inorganic diphosphatase [Porticoccaceae bacterium]
MLIRSLFVFCTLFSTLADARDSVPAERGAVTNIMHYPQPRSAPDEVFAVIEIPAGTFTKYELDHDTGFLIADRFQSMPVVYPANYGTLPSTLAGDNDPLDILVYTREPVIPGALIKVKPIGVLKMLDGGEQDDKIIAVPVDDVDPTYANIDSIIDLPAIEHQRLLAFFRVYKQLPEGRKVIELQNTGDAKDARQTVNDALRAYERNTSN